MKVFYHNDMDGKCAAHVINSYDDWPTPSSSMIAINYGIEFPFDCIEEGERVYILDYSIEPEEMRQLLDITPTVIWIDHHKTAIEKYATSQHIHDIYEITEIHIDGIREVGKAGCVLTYEYLAQKYDHVRDEVPLYIRLVGDRDIWAWEYGDLTREVFAGLQAEDTFPRAPVWDALRWQEPETIDMLRKQGRIIQKYKDQSSHEYLRENAFPVTFAAYNCIAVNGRYSSEPFEAVFPDADIWMPFRYMKDGYWMVSLYTNKDIDVSEIAKRFEYHGKRGGGHKQAAGFECDYPPFLVKQNNHEKSNKATINLYDRDGSVTKGEYI